MEEILKKIDKIIKPQPCLNFDIKKQETTVFDSKLGGTPYWPNGKDYPTDSHGKNLFLLAQLNFDKLPHIPNFPKKGILQFFISDDDLYGMNWDDNTVQEDYRVIYHENISDEIEEYKPEYDKNSFLPFEDEYLLVPKEPSEMPIDAYDFRWSEAFNEVSDTLMGDLEEEDFDKCYNRTDRATVYIGGYPIFVQYDPREAEKSYMDCDVVLFQCDSYVNKKEGINILWGDMGIGVFMIPLKNLMALDFSKVLYYYDCC